MIKKRYFVIAIALAVIASATCVFGTNWCNKKLKELKAVNDELTTMQNELENELHTTRSSLQIEIEKNNILYDKVESIENQLNLANTTLDELHSEEYELIYLGEFKLTAYCAELHPHICGEGRGITASGTKATPGRTIGVDPSLIPYGTEVYIEGIGWRTAEDTGGAINEKHIDVLVDRHESALKLGVNSGGVWILVKKS